MDTTIEYWQLAATFIINILTLVLLFFKQSRVSVGIKYLSEKVVNLEDILNQIWKKDVLKTNLSQGIQMIATEHLRNNEFLLPAHRDIMMIWTDKIEQFAKDAYYTKYRGKSGVKDFLNGKSNSMLSELESYMIQIIPEKVKFRNSEHSITDFIKSKSNIYEEIKILNRTLVKNGLSDEEYVELFEEYTRTQLSEGTKSFMKWANTPKI